jgi:hypothetical protein
VSGTYENHRRTFKAMPVHAFKKSFADYAAWMIAVTDIVESTLPS